jgi:hypothetical protein
MPDSREYMRKVLRRGLLDVNYYRGHVRLRAYLGRMVVFGYRHSRDGLCDNQEFSELVHNTQNAGEAIRYIGSVRCGDASAEVARFLAGEGRTQPFLEQGMTFARCRAQIPAPLGEVRIGMCPRDPHYH